MRSDLAPLHTWLSTHNGVVAARNLRSLGYATDIARSLVRAGHLVVEGRGIYRSPHIAFGRLQVMTAACLVNPFVAIGLTTAGQELRFRGMIDALVHALVPHGSSPELPGVVVHRTRRIDPVDLSLRRSDGVVLTSPPRTLFDAAAILNDDVIASAIEQAIADRMCTMGTLLSTSARLHHPNRPGAQRFQAVLRSRPTLRGAARSELERTVRAAIAAAGLPAPMVNMPHRLPDGTNIQIDLAWPDWQVAAEVDHPFWHDREAEAARDKWRDRKLLVMGWLTPRLSRTDVDVRLPDAVQDLRDLLVRRGWVPDVAA